MSPNHSCDSYSSEEEGHSRSSEASIKEATESTDITSTILRKPGDRWNFARSIDEKFNQSRLKKNATQEKKEREKRVKVRGLLILFTTQEKEETGSKLKPMKMSNLHRPPNPNPSKLEETPQEKLKRKMRTQIQEKMRQDELRTMQKVRSMDCNI